MLTEPYDTICARHPDLVALHESPRGELAILLRHALVPGRAQRPAWRRETRRVAHAVRRDLRRAGVRRRLHVAQWMPPARRAHALAAWPCVWQGDPRRAGELRASARQGAVDARFLAGRATRRRRCRRASRDALELWYTAMAPVWLGVRPEVRRQLLLQTHVWITERALDDGCDSVDDGALTERLERLVPPDDRALWRPWIAAVTTLLDRALDHPPALRDARWARGLFLAALRVPAPLATEMLLSAL